MGESDKRHLDAYLAGELPPSGQRELAQASLDDPELFELLASAAVVNASADTAFEVSRRSNPGRVRWMLIGAATAAAAIVVVIATVDRSPSNRESAPASTPPPSTSATAAPAQSPGVITQPIILAARFNAVSQTSPPEFRTATAASRAPKEAGAVAAVEGGEIAIDLGSLDGVAKGSELQVARSGKGVGRLTIATVFRERSRGRMTSPAAVEVGDRVEVPLALQSQALLEQALSRIAAGDREAARALATRAAAMSGSTTGAEGAETMNEIAAVLIDHQEYAEAGPLLRRAQSQAVGTTAVRVANNMAALAALQGDVAAAEGLYRSALTLPGSGAEFDAARRSIEKNLQALKPQ